MLLAKKYILKKFNHTFFTMFFVLFTISSIIILIKTANISASIGLGFIDFFKIYSYSIPATLFYILPVIFFISACISLSQMSLDSEILVMFSFGLKMRSLYFIYFTYAFLFSTMLLIISMGLIPVSKHLKNTFIQYKTLVKGINFSNSSEFGQKFGDWFIFINKDKNDNLSNIVLFKNSQTKENIVIAKKASLQNAFSLELTDGKVFDISRKNISEISYSKMLISNPLNNSKQFYQNLKEYWSNVFISNKLRGAFIINILLSLFPILSIHAIIGLGLLKPRISKNSVILHAFLFTLSYVVLAKILSSLGWIILFIFPAIWILLSYALYYFRSNNKIL
ncbi:Predicted permease YjgP/YjgQ family [hydrothermal vent metagenome]|uniref:Predicted permease YjgP/YjgQ family n=1 Tax=hydrothermal vent metagenome TaxID=652676 RepID=A0A3B1DRR5_9ZZZZ